MYPVLYVFFGGGLGSVCRYAIGKVVIQKEGLFPFATFAANVLSCLVLGYLIFVASKKGLSPNGSLLLMTGFCGGFSTFSTFTAESYKLILSGEWTTAFLYVACSFFICLLSVFLGLKIGQVVG